MRSDYDVLGYRVAVASNSAAFIDTLDRLNVEFRAPVLDQPMARYEVVDLHGIDSDFRANLG